MNKKILAGVVGAALAIAGGASYAFADTSVGPTSASVTLVEGSTSYSYLFANGYNSDANEYYSGVISCPTGTSVLNESVSAPGAGGLEGAPPIRPATYDSTTGFPTGERIELYSDDNGTGTIYYYVECITLPS